MRPIRRAMVRLVPAVAILWIGLLISGCQSLKPPDNTVGIKRVMECTGYCKCKKCCNWRRSWWKLGKAVVAEGPAKGKPKKVGITASGTKAKRGVIAADTSRYPFGTVMYVPGYGYGRVEDRGSAIQGEHLDLCFGSHKEALQWGRRRVTVTIYVPRRR